MKQEFIYSWETRKLRFLFPIKRSKHSQSKCYLQKNMYMQRILYGETKCNSEVRWNEYYSLKKTSELGDHLLADPDHDVI